MLEVGGDGIGVGVSGGGDVDSTTENNTTETTETTSTTETNNENENSGNFTDETESESEDQVEQLELAKERLARRLDPLSVPTDHSKIAYKEFRRCFWVEAEEIKKMSDEDVMYWRAMGSLPTPTSGPMKRSTNNVRVRGLSVPRPFFRWSQCGLASSALISTIEDRLKFRSPTLIQSQTIPVQMSGRDLIGIAKTGSGKTMAFLLPLIRHVMDQPPVVPQVHGPISLILSPTRELAMQTADELRRLVKLASLPIRLMCAYGGIPINEQISEARRGVEVMIGTPGRLLELLSANKGRVTNLRRVTLLILDEADRMFDLGFGPQVLKISSHIRPDRQAVLFSATFPPSMEALARKMLRRPVEVVVGQRSTVNSSVKQEIYVLEPSVAGGASGNLSSKFIKLLQILGEWYDRGKGSILIFVDRQEKSENLVRDLLRRSFHCNCLHGGMDQDDRDSAIDDFKRGILPILVATSIAARGLDVKSLNLVLNYDPPNHMEDYVHRVGRTGRAGAQGTAITFIEKGADDRWVPEIVKALIGSGQVPSPELMALAANSEGAAGRSFGRSGGGFGGRGLEHHDREKKKRRKTERILHGDQSAADSDSDDVLGDVDVDGDGDDDDKSSTKTTSKTTKTTTTTKNKRKKQDIPKGVINVALWKEVMLRITSSIPLEQQMNPPSPLEKLNNKLAMKTIGTLGGSETAAAAVAAAATLPTKIGDINIIYNRSLSPPTPHTFWVEHPINSLPQAVRLVICSKESLQQIHDFSKAIILVKGEYVSAGGLGGLSSSNNSNSNNSGKGLYVRIESSECGPVELAYREVKRIIGEAMLDSSSRGAVEGASRYGLFE